MSSEQVKSASKRSEIIAYGLALLILSLTAVGVFAQAFIVRLPVPWPAGIEVDSGARCLTMPDAFGDPADPENPRYVSVVVGELGPESKTYQAPDKILRPNTVAELGMNTSYDKDNRQAGRGNWYGTRIYRDTQKDRNDLAYWELAITYYTGTRDAVAHTPQRCLTAGGQRLTSTTSLKMSSPWVGDDWGGYRSDQTLNRQSYESRESGLTGTRKGAAYYTFVLNGRPEPSRVGVRIELQFNPGIEYAYFAKMQFSPLSVGNRTHEQLDEDAAQFAKHFLPEILKMFPTASDIKLLEAGTDPAED